MSQFIKIFWVLLTTSLTISCSTNQKAQAESNAPNFVFIFTDDLGYGDLGCFGATDIKTPHIDRLANEGIKFTNLYSASSVCSPSRAGLLTGRYPQRWGLHGVYFPNSLGGMPSEEVTIAEVLKENGYTTGVVGKWHLGHTHDHAPLQQGFDSYFGIPYSNDMESVVYMRDNSIVEWDVDQTQMVKRYTTEANDFINQNKDHPFYLYVAHNMPHVPIYASDDFIGSSERGLYGDVIQEIDWSVGEIVKNLKSHGLLENTIVVFSSDNGPWLVMEDHGGSAGDLREGKQYTFDGGMKVPSVAMWKGHFPEGKVCDQVISQMDWFPTFSNLAGATIPDTLDIDGYDITSVLLENEERKDDEILLFGLDGELQGFRDGDYKLKLPFSGNPGSPWMAKVPAHDTLLFNLITDPGEQNNLLSTEKEVLSEMLISMKDAKQSLGEIVPLQIHRTPQDNSHLEYLSAKHGKGVEYWKNK